MTRKDDIQDSPRQRPARRVMAAVMGLLFLLSGSGMLPALLAALAGVDGAHRVSMVAGGQSLRLVLSHEDAVAIPHRHSLLAELVTGVSSSRHGEADHVLDLKRTPLRLVPSEKLLSAPAEAGSGVAATAPAAQSRPQTRAASSACRDHLLEHQRRRLSSVLLLV